ncbi:MAG: hypothetical protein DMG05_02605 [Acidobacteria bacterium]|nr:MAG: hypothetical protein DMG05_02605 [Acidobacteriota bacterium]
MTNASSNQYCWQDRAFSFKCSVFFRFVRLFSVCALLILTLNIPLLAQSPPDLGSEAETFIEKHFSSAKGAEATGNLPRAAEEYQAILKKYPRQVPEVYQNLGLVFYLQRQYEAAIATLEKGIRLKAVMPGAHLFAGISYLAVEQPEKALPHLKAAFKLYPTNESSSYLSAAYSLLGKYEAALPYLKSLLESSEEKDNILYLLGDNYQKLANQEARVLSDETPDRKYGHLLTAKIFDAQEYFQMATKEYLDAAKLDPGHAEIFFSLGRVLAILGQGVPSRLSLERYHQLLPSERHATLGTDGLVRREIADIGVKVDYEKLVRSLPPVAEEDHLLPLVNSDVRQMVKKKMSLDKSGRWKQVLDSLMRARWIDAIKSLEDIQAVPKEWLRDYLIAKALAWNDDYMAAEKHFNERLLPYEFAPAVRMLRWEILQQLSLIYCNRLLDEYPKSSRAHYLRARTLDVRGKKEALEEYLAAIDATPTMTGLRISLADHYLSNSKYGEALEACQKELEISPYSSAAKSRIGRIYVQLREPDDGWPYLEDVLKADPSDAQTRTALARGWELKGNMEKALEEYKLALQHDPGLNRLHYVLARIYRKRGRLDLAERETQIFQQNEKDERRKLLERVEGLRKSPEETLEP